MTQASAETIGKMPDNLKLRAGCPCFPSNGWVRGEGNHLVPCPAPGHADEHPAHPDPATAWNLTDTSPANPMAVDCEECGERVAMVDRCPVGFALGHRQCRPCGARVWAEVDARDPEAPCLDEITRKLSSFVTFEELLGAAGGYRPTIHPDSPDKVRLADAYDAAQAERGDPRRAFRGSARKAGAA